MKSKRNPIDELLKNTFPSLDEVVEINEERIDNARIIELQATVGRLEDDLKLFKAIVRRLLNETNI
jgi:hypothetical protein